MRKRRAISLLELLLIMSACTMILTLTGSLLHRVMRIQMQSRSHANAERNALRLSNQFRQDVHAARAAAPGDADARDGVSLSLELADGRVAKYSRVGRTVLRIESGGSKPTWREEFTFPAASEVMFTQQSEPSRLVLTITAAPAERSVADGKAFSSGFMVPVSVHAEAVVGRDLRFATMPAGEGATE